MTLKWAISHCEKRSDEAISSLATGPSAGMTALIDQYEVFDFDSRHVLE